MFNRAKMKGQTVKPLATLRTASTGYLAVVLTLLVVSGTPAGAVASDPEASNLDEVTLLLREGRYADAERLATGLLKRIEADAGAESLDAANVLDVVVEARFRGGKSRRTGENEARFT